MKTRNFLFVLLVLCLTTWVMPTISGATVKDDVINQCHEACAVNYTKMLEARKILEQNPSEEWTDSQMQTYLYNALWTVFNAMIVYQFEFDEACTSMGDLVSLGYFPEVPGNPYSDWEQMTLETANPTFSPGNLFIVLAPPDFYSYVTDSQGNRELKPLSFELGIFGPTIEFAKTGLAKTDPDSSWAYVPEGTYFLLSTFTETTAQSDEKRADWLKYKAELAALASKEDGND